MKTRVYQICEFESFFSEGSGREMPGYHALPPAVFSQLEHFLLERSSSGSEEAFWMTLSIRRGFGKVITIQNYVGVILMEDGTLIEILPKIHSAMDCDPDGARTKKLLIEMLKTLREAPFKNFQISSVGSAQMNLFEIFVRMFLDEVFPLVKRGLPCGYEVAEENSAFFRGKLMVSQHIRLNFAHQERSYIQHDRFTANRPENRILKATLLYLYRYSRSLKNRADIKVLLQSFLNVSPSTDFISDFALCSSDRAAREYQNSLLWSRVFLEGKSFTSYSGSHLALALLFPMEKLFESYIAVLLQKQLAGKPYSLSIQDTTHHLFDSPQKAFQLRPDLVIRRKTDNTVFVADTKWKLLDVRKPHYGVSQSDLYQMAVYQYKYHAQNVTLLYPRSSSVDLSKPVSFMSKDGLTVHLRWIDLLDAKQSIAAFAETFAH